MTDETFKPLDLSPELQRESEKKDVLIMSKLNKKLGITKYEIKDVIAEMNIRFTQYKGQFDDISVERRILQAVQDFNRFVTPLQIISRGKKIKLNQKLPVASLKDGILIYADIKNSFNVFSKEKPKE